MSVAPENTIDAYWEEFAKAILSPGAPLIQRQWFKRCFYAGALGAVRIVVIDGETAIQLATDLEARRRQFASGVIE